MELLLIFVICMLSAPPAPPHLRFNPLSCHHPAVEGNQFVSSGYWDSIHVVEVVESSKTKASYKLTTTVMLSMSVQKEEVGNTIMAGSLTRQVRNTLTLSPLEQWF